jgi:hypothetical protein
MILTTSDIIPLQKFIEHFVQEMVRADAQAQALQQTGWIEFQRSMGKTDGIDITGGMGEIAYLGLREAKISFYVEPVRPGLWQRLKRVVRYILGYSSAPARQDCRLVFGARGVLSAFQVIITVARAEDGSFTVKSEPQSEQLKSSGEINVTDIFK